ncbi:hypothetical protein [Texcoconibacillus texcoconensis]|uniref:Uncharacterized protein n=1 Tax=Texcoconibacillus texcoconensis TaxID=1095777 RepID=A0A840QQE4_9BACI|nr:hypothetical protein [Texcoconibacillus texcoconensis]MBB5173558.1 hypothetical protein [Texcoconibacillus texcoconensis]
MKPKTRMIASTIFFIGSILFFTGSAMVLFGDYNNFVNGDNE